LQGKELIFGTGRALPAGMNTTSTLADLATTHPAASRVFQRFGLDYCCGGRKPLEDVCRSKGLDAATVLAAIEDAERVTDLPRWDSAPLPALIRFIVDRYHNALRVELPELVTLAERVEARHADKASTPWGLAAHLQMVHASVLDHLAKEEQILFPMIAAGHGARALGPVRVMEEEHEDHSRNLLQIRLLTNNLTPPDEACPTWRALYLRLTELESELFDHIHLENNVLFPRALAETEEG
jgi:regulator of cell morphogenesis and NO signaling